MYRRVVSVVLGLSIIFMVGACTLERTETLGVSANGIGQGPWPSLDGRCPHCGV